MVKYRRKINGNGKDNGKVQRKKAGSDKVL